MTKVNMRTVFVARNINWIELPAEEAGTVCIV